MLRNKEILQKSQNWVPLSAGAQSPFQKYKFWNSARKLKKISYWTFHKRLILFNFINWFHISYIAYIYIYIYNIYIYNICLCVCVCVCVCVLDCLRKQFLHQNLVQPFWKLQLRQMVLSLKPFWLSIFDTHSN